MRATHTLLIFLLSGSALMAEPAKTEDHAPVLPPATVVLGDDGVLKPIKAQATAHEVTGTNSSVTVSASRQVQSLSRSIHNPCPDAPALGRAAARELVTRIATEADFFPDFVTAVSKVESAFVSNSFSGRAYGLMQLTPATAERFKVNICDPEDNVRGGVAFLRHLHKRFRNPFYILAAYNAGEQTLVDRNGLPPFPETLTYIARVMNEFYDWPEIADGRRSAAAEKAEMRDQPTRLSDTTGSLGNNPQKRHSATRETVKREDVQWQSGFVANFD